MSEKLEGTINQLRSTNIELERDIERKSKIDEMLKINSITATSSVGFLGRISSRFLNFASSFP